jgi:hypothetical protein
MLADAEVAEKLFHRAKGYSHPEIKVFCHDGDITTHGVVKHYPPDTRATIAWLRNRRKQNWRGTPAMARKARHR